MVDASPPSFNPTGYRSLNAALNFTLQKFLQGVDDMLPAQIVSYDRISNTAQVQPLIAMVTTDNITLHRAAVQRVPVIQIGGGGYTLNFPIGGGDLGFIKANDRDISLFVQSLGASQPNTARKHSFEDAVFIPAVLAGYTIASEDEANTVLQSLDGTVKISLGATAIKIEAPVVNIVSTGGTTNMTGDFHISGDAVIGGKSFLSHVHGGVQTGGGDTGPPA